MISLERNVGRVCVSTGQLVGPLRVCAAGVTDRDVDAIQLSIGRFETRAGWEERFLSDQGTEIYLYTRVHVSYVIKVQLSV